MFKMKKIILLNWLVILSISLYCQTTGQNNYNSYYFQGNQRVVDTLGVDKVLKSDTIMAQSNDTLFIKEEFVVDSSVLFRSTFIGKGDNFLSDSVTRWVTITQLTSTLTAYVLYSDSNTTFVTPTDLNDTLPYYVLYGDSGTTFVTPTDLTTNLGGYVDTTNAQNIYGVKTFKNYIEAESYINTDKHFEINNDTALILFGTGNISLGLNANSVASSGEQYNINIGTNSGIKQSTNSGKNISIGYNAASNMTTGSYDNISIGVESNNSLTSSKIGNTGIGYSSLYSNISNYIIGIGYEAGRGHTNGTGCLFIGYQAGYSNAGQSENNYIGYASGRNNVGSYNTWCGYRTGTHATGVINSSYFGDRAGENNILGDQNSLFGYECGSEGSSVINSCFFGSECGRYTIGTGNVFMGYQVGRNDTCDNMLKIDNSNTATPLIDGNFATNYLKINGDLDVANIQGNTETQIQLDANGTEIQERFAFVPSGDLSVSTNDSITVSNTIMRLVGNGGSATSVGVNDGLFDGQTVYLQGTDDVNTVVITDGLNIELDGGSNVTLGKGDMLFIVWDSGDNAWYMISKSNN